MVCKHGNAFGTLLTKSYVLKQMMQFKASTIWDSSLLGVEESMAPTVNSMQQKIRMVHINITKNETSEMKLNGLKHQRDLKCSGQEVVSSNPNQNEHGL